MDHDPGQERILILDFGSQYSQLIARRVRELGVYCELHPFDQEETVLRALEPVGVILSGGPTSAAELGTPQAPEWIFELGVPILGICYGMQTMAAQLGGEVAPSDRREFGYARVEVCAPSALLTGIEDHLDAEGHALLDVWMSHGDRVTELPPGFTAVARSEASPLAAIADDSRRRYGLQFHPEVTHTPQGRRILERFLVDICGCHAQWTPGNIIADHVERVRERVGDDGVVLGLSGGVDSSVVAALLHRAIGDRLTCLFVDTGLLRLGEADQVMATFARYMGVKVIKIDAQDEFLDALAGEADPEAKRKIIGGKFIEVFEREAKKLAGVRWLAQGTIYPDVIESAGARTGKAQVIKSHHNVGGLPERMDLGLIEPLRDLFKDEVRRIGVELGLPHDMVHRHPFPGPGLAVRVLGEVRREYLVPLAQADRIFIDELSEQGHYDRVSQAFAVFLPVQSVGVTGDARSYEWVIALRAVETVDFMTARWADLPYAFLDHVSRRIINEVRGISRVVYDISGKPPATIEWE